MPIKRHKGLAPLSRDHHRGLILAQLIKKDAPEYKDLPKTTSDKIIYTTNFYKNELVKHFTYEEEILYPSVKNKSTEIDELFEEIISEHKKIKQLIVRLDTGENKTDILNDLGVLLESHIRKEERVLFEKIQNLLTDKELMQLEDQLS
ncbi:MAG: hemerythrin domain-containing protein [Ignavibacteriaceae bacterium]|nr:hemerythrin domain-containing protein [Ignavibacteriaceae bacterium]